MNFVKCMCLLAYGILLANVGFKIYEKYKVDSNDKSSPIEYGKTASKKVCTVQVKEEYCGSKSTNNRSVSEILALHESFVERQLHNKSKQIECFFGIDTEQYQLTRYTRSDVAAGNVELNFIFVPRNPVNQKCYRKEYTLVLHKTGDSSSSCSLAREVCQNHPTSDIRIAFAIVVISLLICGVSLYNEKKTHTTNRGSWQENLTTGRYKNKKLYPKETQEKIYSKNVMKKNNNYRR